MSASDQWSSWFIADFTKRFLRLLEEWEMPEVEIRKARMAAIHTFAAIWPDQRLQLEVWYMLEHDVSYEDWDAGKLPDLHEWIKRHE